MIDTFIVKTEHINPAKYQMAIWLAFVNIYSFSVKIGAVGHAAVKMVNDHHNHIIIES
jgi:hypothetical protein